MKQILTLFCVLVLLAGCASGPSKCADIALHYQNPTEAQEKVAACEKAEQASPSTIRERSSSRL